MSTAFAQACPNLLVNFVSNGQEIIDCLQNDVLPRLVLVDMQIRDKSAFEILRWIKENGWLKRFPVMFVSSAISVIQMDLLLELGASGCWLKPSDLMAILSFAETINEYISAIITLREKMD